MAKKNKKKELGAWDEVKKFHKTGMGKAIQGAAKRAAPVGAHLKKHRRAYGWGVTGAAAWDILDRDD